MCFNIVGFVASQTSCSLILFNFNDINVIVIRLKLMSLLLDEN